MVYEDDEEEYFGGDGPELVTIDDVLAALTHMLDLYLAYRDSGGGKTFVKSGFIPLSSPDVWILDVVSDPIRYAYQMTIRRLGQALFRKFDQMDQDPLGQMEAVVAQLSRRDPAREMSVIDILDKNWDGVGDGNRRWMA